MKTRLLETGKTLLIVLLVISLVFLTAAAMPAETIRTTPWLSAILQPFATVLGLPEAELVYVEQIQPISDAAQPLIISLRNSSGRYTAQWDFDDLDGTYEKLGGFLGEALETAGTFAKANLIQVRRALSQSSVSFDYDFDLPAELLASWLDAGAPEQELTASQFILAAEGETVSLYLVSGESYRANTQIDPKSFLTALEQFKADGSQFAFETDSQLAPLSLRPVEVPYIEGAYATSPCDKRYVEVLATALGFNAYDENRYTNSAGVTYFSEPNCNLQVGADGRILLNSTAQERFRASASTLQAKVEYARTLVDLTVGSSLGDARIYLSGVTNEEEVTVCTFDYVLSGVPVSSGAEPAVSVTFSGQSVTQLRLLATTFTLNGTRLSVLPPVQAEAVLPKGSRLALEYDFTDSGDLTAGWKLSAADGETGR